MTEQHLDKQIKLLDDWIKDNSDLREIKRAIAVKLAIQGWNYSSISKLLNVSTGFISKWNKRFQKTGLEGLKLSYKGSSGYLTKQQKQDVLKWLHQEEKPKVEEVKHYLIDKYDIQFKSKSSYYNLIKEAQNCWLQLCI